MTPVAAYFMFVAMEHESAQRPRYRVTAPRRSVFTKVADALGTLVTGGRRAAAQPA